jgi:predicted RNA-binding Zn-ribbon protein involved in translation (DUF1610 family)
MILRLLAVCSRLFHFHCHSCGYNFTSDHDTEWVCRRCGCTALSRRDDKG